MQEDARKNKPPRPRRNTRRTPGDLERTSSREAVSISTSPQHTARERERIQTGLRILARMIARTHLSRQASGSTTAPAPDEDAGN